MERHETFQFDDDEIHIIAEALSMYAGYKREMELNMLVGDESDADKIANETQQAETMARNFFEIDNDETWEEMSGRFQEAHSRPADINDVSKFDWFEFVRGTN